MPINKPVKAGHLLSSLYRCVKDAVGLDSIPGLLKQILEDELWREVFIEEYGEIVTYDKFNDFVTTAPPHGLGSSVDTLIKLCGGHGDVTDKIDEAVQRKPGKLWDSRTEDENITDNVSNNLDETAKNAGNGKQSGLRRLRSEIDKAKSPEKREKIKALQKQVFNNEISVHKALITIGARRETFTIPVEPKSAARSIKKRFASDQIAELITLLSD